MGIISVKQADHLYWLGRYTERVYTTLRIYSLRFDEMIDAVPDGYQQFCESIDIPNIYSSREDFLKKYPFDESNPDSLISNLNRAYDNAIVLRESIGSEALSYIQMAIYEMTKARGSESPMIELQGVLDLILAFWGSVDDQIDSEQVRNIIKAGKQIERIDLYARIGLTGDRLTRAVHRMIPRVERSGIPYSSECVESLKQLIKDPAPDHSQIIEKVEAIFP